jgi:hypothetical protein
VVNLQVDLLMLDARWYVTHSGLLRVAHRRRCSSITTELVEGISNPNEGRWVFKASVVKSGTVHFVGYGDANPSNVSALVHGAEMWLSRPQHSVSRKQQQPDEECGHQHPVLSSKMAMRTVDCCLQRVRSVGRIQIFGKLKWPIWTEAASTPDVT